jgi:peptidyl-tRNA hydrolase
MSEEREVKMVVVIRKDLKNKKGEKVRSGKIVSQGIHSAFGFIWQNLNGRKICFELSDAEYQWYQTGQTKITLEAKNEKELLDKYQAAKDAGLKVELITDAGRTEFDGPTKTCFCIMPDYADKIDAITRELSTY